MIIKDSPDMFDQLRTNIPQMGSYSQDKSNSGFLQNDELTESEHVSSNSRTAYHLDRAQKSGNTSIIEEYPEPLAYKLRCSKTGLLTKKSATITIIRLSILKVLAQGGKPEISSQEHTYEILFSGNKNMIDEAREAVSEWDN